MNRVVVGATAPMKCVMMTNKSYQMTKRTIMAQVNNHNQEYSSRNLLRRTSSTTNTMIRMLTSTAKIFWCKTMIIRPLLFQFSPALIRMVSSPNPSALPLMDFPASIQNSPSGKPANVPKEWMAQNIFGGDE